MAELADAADSKSADRKVVGVRPPLPAPYKLYIVCFRSYLCGESVPKPTRLFTLRRELTCIATFWGTSQMRSEVAPHFELLLRDTVRANGLGGSNRPNATPIRFKPSCTGTIRKSLWRKPHKMFS